MSFDENNISKNHVKTSKANDKSSFQETLKKDHQIMTQTRKQKLRKNCLIKKKSERSFHVRTIFQKNNKMKKFEFKKKKHYI